MPTGVKTYPIAGTHADRVLAFVRSKPGVTTNGVIEGLKLNPALARKCLANLLEHEAILDEPDENGHHHYTARKLFL